MGGGYHGGFGSTKGASDSNELDTIQLLISELKNSGIKFNEKDIVFIVKDKTGQIVWLENGNPYAGLIHILDGKNGKLGHAKDFKNAFNIERDELGSYLKKIIANGDVISNKIVSIINGRKGYERVHEYEGNYYVMTGIGTNGFIVSAYPIRKDDL